MRVRYYGHVGKPTGYGRAAEHMCRALIAADVDIVINPCAGVVAFPDDLTEYRGLDLAVDATIVHDLPLDAARVAADVFSDFGQGRLIVYTTWEGTTIPEAVLEPLVRTFSQIWVPSSVTAQCLIEGAKLYGLDHTNIHAMPHAYDSAAPAIEREFRTGERFRFFWYGAWNARKNPIGLIQAYAHAFGNDQGVELLVHSQDLSAEQAATALGSTGLAQTELPPIRFSNGHKALSEIVGDCYVTAARGEAWNLPAFESAVFAGAMVISPHSLGSDDYLMSSSAKMIGSTRAPAWVDQQGSFADGKRVLVGMRVAQGLSSRSLWREPSLVQLARAMQDVREQNERAICFGYNTAEKFGYPAVGRIARRLLDASLNHH